MGATAPASIGTGTATGGSVVATTTGAVPVNAIVIVACFDDKTAGSITFSTADTGTNTYTNAQQCTQSGAKAALLYSLTTTAMAAASSVTTTMDGAAGSAAQALWTIGGISLSSPLDIAVQTGGSGTAPSVSTGALAQPFEIIIATIVVKAGSAQISLKAKSPEMR